MYLATKLLSLDQRRLRQWTGDFNAAGANRTPVDPTPLFTIFNVTRIAVYKGYYILTGLQAGAKYGTATDITNGTAPGVAGAGWQIGPVIASKDSSKPPRPFHLSATTDLAVRSAPQSVTIPRLDSSTT